MTDEKKPRVFYAVWEDEEDGDDGYKSGAISTEGGGNLYWCDNQFPVIEYAAYEKLQSEVERLQLEVIKRNQYKVNEEHLANIHKHYEYIEAKLQAAESDAKALAVALDNAHQGITQLNRKEHTEIKSVHDLLVAWDWGYEALTPEIRERYLEK